MDDKKFGSAVILCGGKSSRMGFDKCGILVGGVPLFEKIAQQLETLFDDIIIVSNQHKNIKTSKYKVVKDLVEELGPAAGILTGLHHAQSEYVFFIACDMPFISLEVIRLFEKKLETGTFMGAVGIKNGYIEPFYSFYSKPLIEKIKKAMEEGHIKISISRMIKNEEIYKSPETEWRCASATAWERIPAEISGIDIFSNINYLKDIEMLHSIYDNEVEIHGKG